MAIRPPLRWRQPDATMRRAWETFRTTTNEAVRGLLNARPDLDPWSIYRERRTGLLVRLLGFSEALPLTCVVEAGPELNLRADQAHLFVGGPRRIDQVPPADLAVVDRWS